MGNLAMPKKMSLNDRLAALDKISDKFNQKCGKKIMGRIGADEEILEKLTLRYIPLPSHELNMAIDPNGGGLPRGRCTIVTGQKDSGKTSILLETIGENQHNLDGTPTEFIALWIESENSLTKDQVIGMHNIIPEQFSYIQVPSSVPAETILDTVQGILQAGVVDMVVINSLSCLVPDKEMNTSLQDATVALQARMNSRLTRKFTPVVSEFDTAFVIVAHLTTQIGSMSRDPMVTKGGEAIGYWSALTIDFRKRAMAPSDPYTKEEAIKICATIKKNHCRPDMPNPYRKVEYYAVYGQGIDKILPACDRAVDVGLLEPHGNWLWWKNLDDPQGEPYMKFTGKGKYREYMTENREEWVKFLSQLEALDKGSMTGVEECTSDEVAAIEADEAAIKADVDKARKAEKKKSTKKKAAEPEVVGTLDVEPISEESDQQAC